MLNSMDVKNLGRLQEEARAAYSLDHSVVNMKLSKTMVMWSSWRRRGRLCRLRRIP